MATSDARIAYKTAEAFAAAGVDFAFLHGEALVAGGTAESDVDIVVEKPPHVVLRETWSDLERAGVIPVMYWPYDIGGAASVFLASRDARGGAQLDMLFDPSGIGKEGIRTDEMLGTAVMGRRWPKVGPIDQHIYLIRKRHRKVQIAELRAVLEALRSYPTEEVEVRIDALVSERLGRSIRALLAGKVPRWEPPDPWSYRIRNAVRIGGRLVRPIGVWTSVPARAVAVDLAARFAAYLPLVTAVECPSNLGRRTWWWMQRVAPVRLRPGLCISWPHRHSPFQADIVLGEEPDPAVELVSRMADRVLGSLHAKGR